MSDAVIPPEKAADHLPHADRWRNDTQRVYWFAPAASTCSCRAPIDQEIPSSSVFEFGKATAAIVPVPFDLLALSGRRPLELGVAEPNVID